MYTVFTVSFLRQKTCLTVSPSLPPFLCFVLSHWFAHASKSAGTYLFVGFGTYTS